MEHIKKSTEYFQSAIDSKDEGELLDNLEKASLEVENGHEWLEKANKKV